MKKIELYLDNNFKNILSGWEHSEPYKTLYVNDNVDIWNRALKLDNKYYSVCCSKGDKYRIIELEQFNIEENNNWGTEEITCPICGYQITDSWEYDENDGEYTCEGCGAELEWNRQIEISYSVGVKKSFEPIEL